MPCSFSNAVNQAADKAVFEGTITPRERTRIRKALANPRKAYQLEKRCELEARQAKKRLSALGGDGAGYAQPNDEGYGFDWQALIDFLKQLIPIIQQLISLFS